MAPTPHGAVGLCLPPESSQGSSIILHELLGYLDLGLTKEVRVLSSPSQGLWENAIRFFLEVLK